MGPEGVTNCLMAATRFVLVRIGYDVWNLLPAYQRNIYRTSEPVSSMETGTSVNLSIMDFIHFSIRPNIWRTC